jgi:hypothetical protein
MQITEIENDLTAIRPTKEIMKTSIEGINPNLPNKNGFIYTLIGAPGTGKSSLLLSLFRDKNYYKMKFEKVYLITPESSFLSVQNHPFKDHEEVHHELSSGIIDTIYEECLINKQECIEENIALEHACLIIDDFASELKNNDIIQSLKKLLTKSRHICLSVIFTLQAYNLFPLVLRKMITDLSIFKPKNKIELESIRSELIGFNKEKTQQLCEYVFDEEYNHLDINTTTGIFRKNFRQLEIK